MFTSAGVVVGVLVILAASSAGKRATNISSIESRGEELIAIGLTYSYYGLAVASYLLAALFAVSAGIWLVLKGYGALPGLQLVPVIDPPTVVDYAIMAGAGVSVVMAVDMVLNRVRGENILY